MVVPIVVGLTWRMLWDNQYGAINQTLSWIAGYEVNIIWLGHRNTALFAMIVTDVWQWTPFMFLIMLAAIQALPHEPFEAAAIDGASTWQSIIHIALPMLHYPILVAVLLRTIDAFRVYDLIFMMTRGGPINATDTLSWSVYNVGFRNFNMGYAAALSWIILIIVTVIVTIFIRLLAGRGDQSA
jgi:multiple sugar transport system permease protein